MPTVAEQLRVARETAQLTPQQIAESTKLKVDQVVALETGEYACFPAPVYIRGSIRTYAKLLRLDVPKLMSQLDEEFSTSKELRAPPPLIPPANGVVDWIMLQFSKLDWRFVVGFGVVVVLLIVAWSLIRPSNHAKKADPLSNLGPGLYTPRTATHRGEVLPLPTNAPAR